MSDIAVQPDDASRPLPRALDVSHLPAAAFDHHEPAWWRNLLAILIETTTLTLAVASYFYLRHNFDQWPPPRVEQLPFMSNPNPDLLWGTVNLLLILGSVVPMVLTDKAARRKDRPEVMLWLGVMILISILANAIRFVEFRHLNVCWD